MHDDTPDTPAPDDSAPQSATSGHDPAEGPARLVGDELAAAADTIDAGDPTAMLATVHRTVNRRRRRRSAVVGIAAAGVLVGSGVVVANLVGGDEGDDLIVSAPVTEPATTEPATTEAEDDDADTPPDSMADDADDALAEPDGADVIEVPTGEPIPVRVVPATMADVVDSGLTVEAANVGQTRLLEWQGGFLSIQTTFEPQPLPPEFPPEIADQFPPEVVELFPDGLPPTINEAIQVLQEADLLDEVSQIISDNRDVYDAVYSEEAAVDTTVRFSEDGVDWDDLAAELPVPDNYWSAVFTTTDRLVIAVESRNESSDEFAQSVDVYASTDLVNWEQQQIPFPAPPEGAVEPPAVRYSTYLAGVAVTDAGFMLRTATMMDTDPMELLPADVRDRLLTSNGNSIGWGDDGLTIEIFDGTAEIPDNGESNPEPTEVLSFTWAELGLDGPPDESGRETATTFVSTWGGQPVEVDSSSSLGWFQGVGEHFVELGPESRHSTNGVDWTPLPVPDDGFVTGIIETSNGAALLTSDERGASVIYEGDIESGAWSPLDLPGLPANVGGQTWARNVFVFQDFGDMGGPSRDPSFDAVGSIQRAEVDGYRYELVVNHTDDEYSATYSVTAIDSGQVIVTESADGLSGDDDPFEYVQDGFGDDRLRILDPSSGDVLVEIPFDAMTQELINADGTTVDVTEPAMTGPPPDFEDNFPATWVVASLDAGWVVEEMASTARPEDRWPNAVAAVGDVALVAWSDGTFTRITPA